MLCQMQACSSGHSILQTHILVSCHIFSGGAWWHSSRAAGSEWRGPGFNPHWGLQVVSLSKAH